jgi:hypothetical protein
MNTKKHIIAALFVLGTSLACMFVERLVVDPVMERLPSPTLPASEGGSPQGCLDRLNEALETRPFDPIGNTIYEESSANFDLVIYRVEGDEIKDPVILYVPADYRKFQEDVVSHRRIWDFYVAIIPSELRKLVKEFVIFTDGPEADVGAWVRPSPGNPDNWQVGFDLLDSDFTPYLAEALVHETAHLLTLNSVQISYDEDHYYYYNEQQNVPACKQLAVDGACTTPNSYINLFYQRFWTGTYAEWWKTYEEAQSSDSDEEYWQILDQFYEGHSELFLNSYAATSIKEDMAESFSFFVLNEKPTGNSIPGQKVAFYYEFPELVEYRRQIIEGLCSYLR